ncbi:tRNA (adenosine(37)-N6)-threonylcarbamoyltransferase complex dimerization subunit type 1 TsaB [Halalkalibacter urbisdiaboli]|uniref:tRNA (adenosine(37)-N6)-threonylcarbamoyltransferase complex dimerization subunit type 1 TsaB n=1 Tax=Halalkalibacter urbisdiaboli TaxID=1960589 RepID=UPI000B438F75|nr:tRNA (adenosine(37)-N6)-threonylcarbamoyltransferase complex dimerization subunit type 1 TsaB [Halalkalibacter urbisdiaboli]
MSKTLAIDTSSFVMGVAVTEGEQVLGEIITNIKKNHSIRLMPAIVDLMKEVGTKPSELERIVVADGPGSYTGVRIGVTTAKTMAWSLQIPIVGISSLEVIAQNGAYFSGLISPIMDARRGQVYTGLYQHEQHVVKNKEDDRLILLADWLELLKERQEEVLFVGQDVAIHRELIEERLGQRAIFPSQSKWLPRPSELARLGLQHESVQSIHTFVPRYLQLAEAEVNWLKSQKGKRDNDD